jgi:hypothetical protein
MKRIFTLFTALLLAGMVNAQTAAVAATSAAVKTATSSEDLLILKETEYDFGKIPQGKPVTHIFEIANKSKDTLKISNVAASCGCTTPEWEKDKPVLSGTGTKITVGYNAAAEGPFTKTITVTYNDAQVKIITIKGEVWKTPAASAPENKSINDLKN